jgi:hypothetical protein
MTAPNRIKLITTNGYQMAKPPPGEPFDNLPIYWDAAPGIGGANNYLSKVLADSVPLQDSASFSQLAKGLIVSPTILGTGGKHFQCFFKYNPNQYDYAYTFDTSAIGSTPATSINSTQVRGLALNATISIELFFDRIQDLWIGQNDKGGKYGVLWDIWAVERLCGVYGQSHGGDPNSPPITVPMTLWMGGKNNTAAFNMTGLISGLSVNVTQFDSNMVPSMATVDLQFVRILNPNANISNAGKPLQIARNYSPQTMIPNLKAIFAGAG